MATAGPFLRYGNCLPGFPTAWTGSALFLTFSGDTTPDKSPAGATAAAKTPAVGDSPPTTPLPYAVEARTGPSPAPVLTLEDRNAPGGAGERLRQISAEPLDSALGWTFWRFDLALELGPHEREIKYSVSVPDGTPTGPVHTFYLPPAGSPAHWAYFSCNGLSSDVEEDHWARADPNYLWRDLLGVHSAFPFHILVGGGDQVYSDGVWDKCPVLKEWGALEDEDEKIETPWTRDAAAQATEFYFSNYLENFTQPEVAAAFAAIPTVMVWDDHDIFDGWGSYDDVMQRCPVFQGIFSVALRFYLLFQQHTTVAREKTRPEFIQPSGLGQGFHSVRYAGPHVALLAIDMRTARSKNEILTTAAYQALRLAALDLPPSVEHVVILSGVPLVFPTIPASESILNGIKACFKRFPACAALGRSTGLMDRFGQPEILDDLIDGWVAKKHASERLLFVNLLQEIALAKGVRVTILSGDAHVGGVGRLYTSRRPKLDPHNDPIWMAQIISSAIVNAPPPVQVVRMLLRSNFSKELGDGKTREKMVRQFWPRHPRFDKLLALRNWVDVTVFERPYARPANPADPDFGGLRFSIRAEDHGKRLGYAEEVYDVVVPRAPGMKSVGHGGRRWRRAPLPLVGRVSVEHQDG